MHEEFVDILDGRDCSRVGSRSAADNLSRRLLVALVLVVKVLRNLSTDREKFAELVVIELTLEA